MNSTELLLAFREDIGDRARPPIWSDAEALGYMNDAYFTFVRLTGGIADFGSPDSPWCSAALVPGEAVSPLPPCLLRTMSARLRSSGQPVEIINHTDLAGRFQDDYGRQMPLELTDARGPVRTMILGMRKNAARWIAVPDKDDVADLVVYRLPLVPIAEKDQDLREVEAVHHPHLIEWMKHRAYGKQDADGFDERGSLRAKTLFEEYCARVSGKFLENILTWKTVSTLTQLPSIERQFGRAGQFSFSRRERPEMIKGMDSSRVAPTARRGRRFSTRVRRNGPWLAGP
jgi:hypothetical protein